MSKTKTIELITGFDHGFRYAKCANKKKFLSTVKNGYDESTFMNSSEIHGVVYNGKKYSVGDKRGTHVISVDKISSEKDQLFTKLITLVGIANSLDQKIQDDTESKVIVNARLIVGIPTSLLEAHSQRIKDFLQGIENETIVVNKKTYIITITEVKTVHQFLGALWNDYEDLERDKFTAVYDLGGEHLNVALFDGNSIIEKKSYSEAGYNHISRKLQEVIESHFVRKMDITHMETLIHRNQFKDGYGEVVTFDHEKIKEVLNEHFNKFFGYIRNDFSAFHDVHKHLLSGGTGERMFRFIKESTGIDFELAKEPMFGNAIAFHGIAKEKFLQE